MFYTKYIGLKYRLRFFIYATIKQVAENHLKHVSRIGAKMHNLIENKNAVLLDLALSISQKTATITSLKNEQVILCNEDIEIALLLDEENKQFHINFDNESNDIWKLFIPKDKVTDKTRIKAIVMMALGIKEIDSKGKAFITIPLRLVKKLYLDKEIYLNADFIPIDNAADLCYSINMVGSRFFFHIVGFDKKQKREIYIVPTINVLQ